MGTILPSKDYALELSMFNNGCTSFPVDCSKMSRRDRKLAMMKRQRSAFLSVKRRFVGRESKGDSPPLAVPASEPDCLSETGIKVNRMRVNYFFSETRNISEFLDKCTVELKFVNGDREVVAQARSRLFKDFQLHLHEDMGAEKVYKRIVLYTSKLQIIQLDVRMHDDNNA